MLALAEEITSTRTLPRFAQNVLRDDVLADCLRTLHELVLRGDAGFQKEEFLFYLFSALLERCGPSSVHSVPTAPQEVEAVCVFIRQHYAEHLNLEQLCRCAGLSKSTLLRAFVQAKGITPYRYLEAIRIQMARQLLGQGLSPAEAALCTGFTDQSHFTKTFIRFIGLTPGLYREIFPDRSGKEDLFHEP